LTNVSRTNRNGHRPPSDRYVTPHPAGAAFAAYERRAILAAGGKVWEPAAGPGHLARVIAAVGCEVIGTDKFRAKGQRGGRDFFLEKKLLAPAIITNPPFKSSDKIADDFVRHALQLRPRYAAFFLALTFAAGVGRSDLLEGVVGGLKLNRVVVYRDRLTLSPDHLGLLTGGVTSFAWFVWTRRRVPFPTLHRISSDRDVSRLRGAL
jgi:hypothetical protein